MCDRWLSFFEDPTLWWDNRGKNWKGYPEFKHSVSGEGLYISSCPESLKAKLESLGKPPKSCSSGVRAAFVGGVTGVVKVLNSQTAHEAHPQNRHTSSIQREKAPTSSITQDQAPPRKQLSAHFEARNQVLAELKRCNDPAKGRELHFRAASEHLLNKYVATAVITMYSRCGKLEDARKVLDENHKMLHGHVVAWNAMILGYAQNNESELALELFSCMPARSGCEPDARSFVAALKACAGLASKEEPKQVQGRAVKRMALERGVEIHSQAEERGFASDIFVATTLVDMYAKSCDLPRARAVFDKISAPRNIVTWNALLLGYVENGRSEVALELLSRCRVECELNATSYAVALRACGNVMGLELGRELHKEIKMNHQLRNNPVAGTCVVDFYAKCGAMWEAQEAFDSIPESSRDSAAWNALLSGYSQQGDYESVLSRFETMDAKGLVNGITIIFALTACSHTGSIGLAKDLFDGLRHLVYGVAPTLEHFTCMVDFYGRANLFDEALELIKSMREDHGLEPDVILWRTLLGACRKWKKVDVGRLAFESLLELDKEVSAAYVLMAGIYASSGMLKERDEVLKTRKDVRAWKKPGQTWWTDDKGKVHSFVVGRKDHPQYRDVACKVDEVMGKIKVEGYVADINGVFPSDEGVDKEDALCGHSEKLAIACALINSKPGTTIRIVKNLRVCDDCHNATARISKVEDREIVCRDASRLHIFRNGICSCDDYF
ncbi:putative pentatricopeptide repeat-containing protein At3g23330 [Selaginella moellendorffii]|uniref:putative pentatricopeptide repeat-containing protein At3g23330 n=1 Tax=Selaginella moellendorffii TaxID=88036 RepID=UPI000D1C6D27|nr:putative pentatricopeptide repeat-containing protein At3g23330 [Selaginella moellendorffii]|eukprot:XP_024543124.1 putative pentatricopeptide repeat-containing protein At3g23330 [Selaginella moellendorffii]